MIEAGSETTSMQLNNMLIGVLSNPEVLIRAHEELDHVVGFDRAPNFMDEPNLPYIRAMVKVSHYFLIYLIIRK
jgi:cytochrome P450